MGIAADRLRSRHPSARSVRFAGLSPQLREPEGTPWGTRGVEHAPPSPHRRVTAASGASGSRQMPHSTVGACGTPYQYQTPFYDGVFCRDGIISLAPLNTYYKVGVQGQVFTEVVELALYYEEQSRPQHCCSQLRTAANSC